MPRTSNRNTPERDDEGRFTSGSEVSTRSRDDDDDTMSRSGRSGQANSGQANSGQGRGWHGDPEGHAEAGSHSHDNYRGTSRSSSRYDDDDDTYRASGRSSGNRNRDDEGRFTSGSSRSLRDDQDYADWHAYGHDRGWHAHQQVSGFSNRGNRQRDEEGRFTSGSRGYRDDDDRRGAGQGRGWFGDPEGHAEAGSHSHDNYRGTSRSSGRYDDDDDRGSRGRAAANRNRDEEGRFTSNGRH